MHPRFLIITAFLLAVVLLGGCSDGGTAVVPVTPVNGNADARDYLAVTPYAGGQNLGNYQLLLDESAESVSLVELDRTAQKNVTAWASVIIEGYHFDPVERNWYIDVRIANNTNYTGWGCLVVFTELGGKPILNKDGYLFVPSPPGEPKRCPVIAYSKDTEQRIFQPMHHSTRTIVIHIPPDNPGLNPVEFFIDAWYPGARLEPYVEDLHIEPIPPPGNYHIGANIRDWQSPYSNQLVVKGIIQIADGEDPFVFDLYDDGEHGDGLANDYQWGADFMLEAPTGHYLCVVKAWDPQGHSFENDIVVYHEAQLPCDPIPNWLVEEGPHSAIGFAGEWIFYEEAPFVDWWNGLKAPEPPPPPPIFWQYHQVAGITLGERPTTGYWIRIDQVCIDNETDTIHIDYTEMVPGANCPIMDIITQPYIIIGMQRFEGAQVAFHKHEEIYDCPPCEPIPHEIIEEGQHSNIHEPIENMIWNNNQWVAFYAGHKPGEPAPPINFEGHGVAVIMLGDRPTTGFWVRLDDVCIDDMGVHIRYTEMIPGPDCEVEQVITQPYAFVVMAKHPVPYIFEKNVEIYGCPDEDCLAFELLVEGPHSGWHNMNRQVFFEMATWHEFWTTHSPGEPPPPVNFEHYIVVAIAKGDHPTTGFFIELNDICFNENENAWIVDYDFFVPGPDVPVDQVITQPFAYYLAQIPPHEAPFIFVEHEVEYGGD